PSPWGGPCPQAGGQSKKGRPTPAHTSRRAQRPRRRGVGGGDVALCSRLVPIRTAPTLPVSGCLASNSAVRGEHCTAGSLGRRAGYSIAYVSRTPRWQGGRVGPPGGGAATTLNTGNVRDERTVADPERI